MFLGGALFLFFTFLIAQKIATRNIRSATSILTESAENNNNNNSNNNNKTFGESLVLWTLKLIDNCINILGSSDEQDLTFLISTLVQKLGNHHQAKELQDKIIKKMNEK